MSYSSRKRYKSRREKADRNWRNIKVVILFAIIALVVLLVRHGNEIYTYLRTFTY